MAAGFAFTFQMYLAQFFSRYAAEENSIACELIGTNLGVALCTVGDVALMAFFLIIWSSFGAVFGSILAFPLALLSGFLGLWLQRRFDLIDRKTVWTIAGAGLGLAATATYGLYVGGELKVVETLDIVIVGIGGTSGALASLIFRKLAKVGA